MSSDYRARAWLFHDFNEPLENTVGDWRTHPGGTMSFHAWDISSEAHDERLAAGPATMPSQHEFDMERLREAGRRARLEWE